MTTKTVKVEQHRADWWEKELALTNVSESAKRDCVIDCITIDFGNGIEADIKLVNSSWTPPEEDGCGPYIDAVLFENGQEIECLEPSDELLGEYIFEEHAVVLS